ncbi:DUF167 domain-containing protein [Malonomonas rubra]|uniref:DUF167 domain-containing protein n=1 Tax=Malonomonas rubra TaxID=57040 RepID=UPI0026EA33F9|nr:DUF167 domain-containing protein [Malonomonas rubra]
MSYPCLKENVVGVILQIQVQPRSSRNQLVGLQGDALKIKLTSPPVDGAANKACCAFLAKVFGVAKGDVELVAGDKSRQKRILLNGLDLATAEQILKSQLEAAS